MSVSIRIHASGDGYTARTYEFKSWQQRLIKIGTLPSAHLVLGGPRVNRLHAFIELGPEGASIRDMGSVHGTYVNGERCETRRLCHNDIVTVGRATLRIALWGDGVLTAPITSLSAAHDEIERRVPELSVREAEDLVTFADFLAYRREKRHTGTGDERWSTAAEQAPDKPRRERRDTSSLVATFRRDERRRRTKIQAMAALCVALVGAPFVLHRATPTAPASHAMSTKAP